MVASVVTGMTLQCYLRKAAKMLSSSPNPDATSTLPFQCSVNSVALLSCVSGLNRPGSGLKKLH